MATNNEEISAVTSSRAIEVQGLTKSFGTNNPINLVKATFDALSRLRTKEEVAELRGVSLE